jgi:lipopolysaccharide/colanic/teichoic acid biosynthesis glycosyltransferase
MFGFTPQSLPSVLVYPSVKVVVKRYFDMFLRFVVLFVFFIVVIEFF